jgi:hypothetical protein
MINITANAIMNLKETPQTLYVHGSIMTYRADDKVTITKAYPQGIISSILILELKVIEGKGPMKGTPKAFHYENSDEIAKTYSQVSLLYGIEPSLTVNIEILG